MKFFIFSLLVNFAHKLGCLLYVWLPSFAQSSDYNLDKHVSVRVK